MERSQKKADIILISAVVMLTLAYALVVKMIFPTPASQQTADVSPVTTTGY